MFEMPIAVSKINNMSYSKQSKALKNKFINKRQNNFAENDEIENNFAYHN